MVETFPTNFDYYLTQRAKVEGISEGDLLQRIETCRVLSSEYFFGNKKNAEERFKEENKYFDVIVETKKIKNKYFKGLLKSVQFEGLAIKLNTENK